MSEYKTCSECGQKVKKKSGLGALIFKYRIAAAMSQKELADALGFKGHYSVTNIEANRQSLPLKKLKSAAIILNIPKHEIIDFIYDAIDEDENQ